jgi:hypothetical protein
LESLSLRKNSRIDGTSKLTFEDDGDFPMWGDRDIAAPSDDWFKVAAAVKSY